MKRALQAILVAALLTAPVLTFAQTSNSTVTRAQVKAELIQIENAGYHPQQKGLHYPDDIQAAEAKLHAQVTMAYGGAVTHANATGGTLKAQSKQTDAGQ